MKRYVYPVTLTPDEKAGGFVVTFPDVRGAVTQGDDREEALTEAVDCLVAALGGYVQGNEAIPIPSAPAPGQNVIYVPALVAAKLALFEAMREQRVTNVALAKRLGVSETVVRRLVHPDHASRIEKVQVAMEKLGKHLLVAAA